MPENLTIHCTCVPTDTLDLVYLADDDSVIASAIDGNADCSIYLDLAGRDKLRAYLNDVDGIDTVTVNQTFHTPASILTGDHADERTAWNDDALAAALAHSRTATFSYAKGDGKAIERRRLKPTNRHDNDGSIVYVGNDPDRDDVRAYRLDRITGTVKVH